MRVPLATLGFTLLSVLTLSAAGVRPAPETTVLVASFKPGSDGAIEAMRLDPGTGRLTPLRRVASVENSYFMTLSPDQRFLYALHAREFGSAEDEQVTAFAITDRDGALRPLNQQSTRGSASCYAHVDRTGKTLLIANYMSGSVASLPVREDGTLGSAVSRIQHAGARGPAEAQEGPHAHCILTSPDNRFVCAADLGLDQVRVYELDAARASLAPVAEAPARTAPGSGPRHLAFHPNGRFLYAINELGGTMTCFAYDRRTAALVERQTLGTLPSDFQGKNACADVKITPNGRFLYGTNRGHDSIAVYRIGRDGRLTQVELTSSLGREPQNLAITPKGDLLLCANLAGNNVAVFRIDPRTGRLSSVGAPVSVPSPSCLQLLTQNYRASR